MKAYLNQYWRRILNYYNKILFNGRDIHWRPGVGRVQRETFLSQDSVGCPSLSTLFPLRHGLNRVSFVQLSDIFPSPAHGPKVLALWRRSTVWCHRKPLTEACHQWTLNQTIKPIFSVTTPPTYTVYNTFCLSEHHLPTLYIQHFVNYQHQTPVTGIWYYHRHSFVSSVVVFLSERNWN